jgi:hypothetical protein
VKLLLPLLAMANLSLAVAIVKVNWTAILIFSLAVVCLADLLRSNAAFQRVMAEIHKEGRE